MAESSNAFIKILSLPMKTNIEDDNILVIEDEDDTKFTTVSEFKKVFNGDDMDPTTTRFYTSFKVQKLLNDLTIRGGDTKVPTIAPVGSIVFENSVDYEDVTLYLTIALVDRDNDCELINTLWIWSKGPNSDSNNDIYFKNGDDIQDLPEYNVVSNVPINVSGAEEWDLSNRVVLYEDTVIVPKEKYVYKTTVSGAVKGISFFNQDKFTPVETIVVVPAKEEKYITNRCNRLSDNGTRQILNKPTGDGFIIDEKNYNKYRYTNPSLRIDVVDGTDPIIIHEVYNPVSEVLNVGLAYYIEDTTIGLFGDGDGIRIKLYNQDPTIDDTIYYTYTITAPVMVPGWNTTRTNISNFTDIGGADLKNINYISIELLKNDIMVNNTIFVNSIVFNQFMKPAICLTFNRYYENTINYVIPYLTNRNIPCTYFLNNMNTIENNILNGLLENKIVDNWDIGQLGMFPNEQYLENPDLLNTYIMQYTGLKATRQWLYDSISENVLSYRSTGVTILESTMNILKDLSYKTGIIERKGFVSEFTDVDFVIPSHIVSRDTPIDNLKVLIREAIDEEKTLFLHMDTVTEYGNELGPTKVMFEELIDFIIDFIELGSVECLSVSEFYNQCIK